MGKSRYFGDNVGGGELLRDSRVALGAGREDCGLDGLVGGIGGETSKAEQAGSFVLAAGAECLDGVPAAAFIVERGALFSGGSEVVHGKIKFIDY